MRTKKKQAIFICQITENSLTVMKCLVGNNAHRQFSALASEAVPPGINDKNLTEKLGQLFRKLEYNNNPLIVSLPRSKVATRYLKVPTQIPSEIENIVSLQAPRYLPYPSNELVTGYQIISKGKEGYADVNLVIAHKGAVDYYIKIFRNLNIKNPKIILSSYGLCNLYAYTNPPGAPAAMLIDVDCRQAELVVTLYEKLVFSRYFNFNRDEVNWKDLFIEEINKTRDAYVRELSREAPQKIILMGQEKVLQELYPTLSQQVHLTVEVLPYEKKVNLSQELLNSIINSDTSFVSLIGLGLKDIEESLDLTPGDIKKEFSTVSRKKERLRLVFSVCFIVLLLGLGIAKDLDNKARYLEKLKTEMSSIAQEAKLLETIEKRFQLLEGRANKKTQSLDILYGLYQVIPEAVFLSNFSYEEDKQVILHGQTSQLNDVSVFVSALQDSPVFKEFNVKIKYATRKITQSGEMLDFEVVCLKK